MPDRLKARAVSVTQWAWPFRREELQERPYRKGSAPSPVLCGLLLAGLCTLPAAAQQATAAPVQAPEAKTKSTPAQPANASPAQGTSNEQNTGVSNPDPVTPDAAPATSSDQNDAAPAPTVVNNDTESAAPENKDELKPAENKFLPDQPSPSAVTPDLDTNKPVSPDPVPSADTAFPVTKVPAPSASSQPSAPAIPAAQITPASADSSAVPGSSAPSAGSAASAAQDNSIPAQIQPSATISTSPTGQTETTAPAPPAQPDAPASSGNANPSAPVPATGNSTPASTASTSPAPSTSQDQPAAQPTKPAAPAASTVQPSVPATTDTAPATAAAPVPQSTTTPVAPAPSTTQQSAPGATDNTPAPAIPPVAPAATESVTPATPSQEQPAASVPQQTATPASSTPADSSTASPQPPVPVTTQQSTPAAADNTTVPATAPVAPATTGSPAPASPSQDQSAPATQQTPSSTPADSSTVAPQSPAPASPTDSSAPQPGDNAAAPASAPAATDNTASAPASASDQPPAAPLPDNQAINPSLPASQVNEPEPPPASRLDLFGGYTYLRPSGKVGTWSFPDQNTRGYIISGSYFFSHHFGVQAEFSHSEYPLGTTGTSPAPPYVQLGGVTDSFYTAEAGAIYRFFLGQRLIPFVHFTGGAAELAGPKFQPPTWGYGIAGGGGVDVLLPHTHDHVAFRLVQADYGHMHADQGALQEYDLAGGTQDVNALRLSAGLVFRFGEMNPIQAKSLACDATPAEVYAGERVTLAATLRNYKDKTKHPFSFSWVLSGGKQQGFGPVIFVDTTGLAGGTYHATAHISAKEKGRQFAQCSTNFVVKPSPAPTLKCSADPSTVTPGQISIITAYAGSIPQRQLTYSYTTSEGQIDGKDNTAQLHTDGLPPGVANVTCRVVDDLGQAAVATTEVTIAPPALPPAPKAQPLCTVYFNRDMRRPARVDNEGRACLDDIALTMEHQPDARLVLIGEHSDSEADGQLTAAERAINTRAYLANEKGIDPSRVDVRTSTTPGRQVQTFLLAPGAVFDQPTEGRIDESKIKIHGQQYARQKMRPPQKGPVGEGVSHPPKN